MVPDVWSVGVIGPRVFLRVRHGPDVYEERIRRRVGSKVGIREFRCGEEVLGIDGGEVTGIIKC